MKSRFIKIPNPGTTEHRIRGAQSDGRTVVQKDLTVRITSDDWGKTLSISNEDDVMLMVPMEPILDRLREVLK